MAESRRCPHRRNSNRGGGLAAVATAAELACIPFDPTGVVCDTSVPTHQLSQGDPADDYKGFTFITNTYPLANAVFDDNWTHLTRGGESSSIRLINLMVPKKIGATVKLPNVGTWTDAQGAKHQLDAMFAVTATNGGLVTGYTNDKDGVEYLALGGLRGDHTDYDGSTHPIGQKVSDAEPQPTDDSKRTGIEVKVSFYYAGTDTPVPDTFKGLTGFGDLDGVNGTPDGIEGMELIDGFDGLWLPDNDHLVAFDENGYGGSDECQEQLNLAARHAQQHMFTAAFSGHSFTVRYSQGAWKSSYAAVFSAPLLSAQLVYKVTAHAVDKNGNEIKAPWTVADGVHVNGTYNLTDIPSIDGYEYVGPSENSAPLKGNVTNDGTSGDKTITLVYKKLATINYNGNGGKGTVAGETVDAGTDVDTKPNGFTRVGYTFKGWNTKADGSGTPYQPGADIRLDGDVTLYAVWEANPYKVAYAPNGGKGTMPEQTFAYDQTQPLSENLFNRPGYSFTGWNTKADGSGDAYKNQQEVTNLTTENGGEVTLYAQWKADPATLHYDANADTATGNTPDSEGVTGDTVTVNENGYANEGYTFTGWNTKPDGTGTSIDPDDKYTLPAGDTTVYAQWERIPGSVNWVKTDKTTGSVLPGSEWRLDGPDGQSITITDNGETDTDPDDGGFTITGLDWGDWTLTETKAPEGHDPIPAPLTFTIDAQHTTVSLGDVENTRTPATVSYDANGGTGTTAPYEGVVGDTPQAAANGFTASADCDAFGGWNTKPDGSGTSYKEGDMLPPLTGDLTLYAQWDESNCKAEGLAQTGIGLSRILTVVGLMLTVGGLATVVQRKRA